ncbi:MAG: DUF2804 domain-containing protein [Gammaproteobacteria bacterium]|nr:DUF2804 domain-containing protein [Gammaproteobacteria bacterium]MBU2058053.1 DUF2804 domain-containing protein [Gammaproteobacteria bacterium]MBU2175960.1 DUF2804 domain-containing protein [Gammaproteobacteria bacterium]MBU2247147.1 DUF2804 domain-containing protein [Gammaproteobacteria bacterium]MBU2343299.1 DUF2804 domain-containing protein [Gammaproteobacteria bacterium]
MSSYQPLLTKVPSQLIQANGQPAFGLFDGSVVDFNLQDFIYQNLMDKKASALAHYFHYKQFQFICVTGSDWLLAVAIADIRYANSGFAYLYRFDTKQAVSKGLLLPGALGCQMSDSPSKGLAKQHFGAYKVAIKTSPTHWQLSLDNKELKASLTIEKANQMPLALNAPTGYNGFTYTEKSNALKVSGSLELQGKSLDLTNALAGYDFSAGFMRRQTSWRWASINAMVEGKAFGLNMAAGVNETGLCENALWFDGQIQHLSPASFVFDRKDNTKAWQVSSLCGEVQLKFQPLYCRQEKVNIGLLASNFRQYVGLYTGFLVLQNGNKLQLNAVKGLAEDHYAKW